MSIGKGVKKIWEFLKTDTWQSWIVSLVLMVVIIKFVFFPGLSLLTGSELPLVVVESCSMYHETNFDEWWDKNAEWYESNDIEKPDFASFRMKNGFSKGDVIFVWGRSDVSVGDIIIFNPNAEAQARYPIIHRVISLDPIATKGDHNQRQLTVNNNVQKIDETNIPREQVIGEAVFRVPFIGWLKLVFFEFGRPPEQRGLCR